jgi:hypothetical protein
MPSAGRHVFGSCAEADQMGNNDGGCQDSDVEREQDAPVAVCRAAAVIGGGPHGRPENLEIRKLNRCLYRHRRP